MSSAGRLCAATRVEGTRHPAEVYGDGGARLVTTGQVHAPIVRNMAMGATAG